MNNALKIGTEYHQRVEKLVTDLRDKDVIVLPSGVSVTSIGDSVLVTMNSPGGLVSGMPVSIDGTPLRCDRHSIEYTAFNTRTNNGIYEVTSMGNGSGIRTVDTGLNTPALREIRRSGKRVSKRNLEQASRAVRRRITADKELAYHRWFCCSPSKK